VFKDASGTEVARAMANPDTARDIGTEADPTPRLPAYQTPAILYAVKDEKNIDVEAGGTVEIILSGTKIRCGTIMLGLSVNAGFTSAAFQNQFNDYSPKEKDQWGNVTYIEGVKQQVHSGTVKLPIAKYDIMNRLISSIGGRTVIVNGSDSKDNIQPDSKSVFASTMLIGRITEFSLRTKMENKKIGDMATYTFTIEENV